MNKAQFAALTAALLACSTSARAQGWDGSPASGSAVRHLAPGFTWGPAQGGAESPAWDWTRIDAIGPAGVPLSRPVAEGQWRLSYSFEMSEFDGLRDGRDDLSSGMLFGAGFSTLPSEATFNTHRLELEHGLGGGWSVFGALPFVDREMLNWAAMGSTSFTTRSSGVGDVSFGTAYDQILCNGRLLRLNLGLSIPTGSVDESDADENGAAFLLPYSMQRGTGTHDVMPGVTMVFQETSWSWGVNAQGRLHVGTNSEGWSWGPSMQASIWASRPWTRRLGTSLRLLGDFSSDLHGDADGADPTRNPIEGVGAQGGDRIDVAGGLQWLLDDRDGSQNLLTVEAAVPVDQWLKGPQLTMDWRLLVGWQWSF